MSTKAGCKDIALPESSHQQNQMQELQIWSQQIPKCFLTFPLLLLAGFRWLLGTSV